MIYDFADKAIRGLNRRNLRSFGRLKLLKFDELNVFDTVGEIYDFSVEVAKRRYKEIFADAYLACMEEMGRNVRPPKDSILNDWLLDMLEDYDVVTHYRFDEETGRKKARTAEALIATRDGSRLDGREVDKALRLWSLQIDQYADRAVDDGRMKAFKDSGVKKLRWNTERDEKVCDECDALDGRVFAIDNVPGKRHFRCRCWLTAVR